MKDREIPKEEIMGAVEELRRTGETMMKFAMYIEENFRNGTLPKGEITELYKGFLKKVENALNE